MQSVGLIGLGLVGSALAARFQAAGRQVIGYDVLVERRDEFSATGGEAAADAADVARRSDVVVLSLPDSNIVAALVESIRPALRQNALLIDTTTGEPEQTAALAASLAQSGIRYVDATIAGSSAQVRDGQAIVMAGGTEASLRAAGELLACFAKEVFHVGPAGSGARMKLVVNLVLGLNRASLAEGLTLAKALSLDLAATLSVLKSGAAYSTVMDTKGPKMLSGDFSPQARLSQHLKDVRLIRAAAERTATQLPLSNVHQQLLERAEAAGWGPLDNSAILRAFER